jgi:nitroreductase
MDIEDCIKTRRSIRKYKDMPVDWDKVSRILDAGKYAPSAGNIQNWKFIVARKEEVRKKLAKASFDQEWMIDAPVHIVIVAEPQKAERFYGARGERLYTIQNCAAVIQNMLLVATELGLGSCWVGAFDETKIKSALNLPEFAIPQAIITIGHKDEDPDMPPRVELENQVYMEKWWGKGVGPRSRGYTSVAIKSSIDDTKKALKKIAKKLKK